MKKVITTVLALTICLFILISCDSEETTNRQDTQETINTQETQGEETAQTTAPETTDIAAIKAQLLANDVYGKAGLELTLSTCEKYYNLTTHSLRTSLTDSNTTTIWPVASYIEMLAEAYRLYPENKTIEKYYKDAINNCIRTYRVVGATIKPPSGKVFTGITYYNAGKNSQGDFYYDDNAWICLQLLNAYELLGDEKYLTQAEAVMKFLWTGWDDVAGGGVYWDKTFNGKGICCNGPVAISLLLGYKYTQKPEYLEQAKMIYEWCNTKLRGLDGIYHEGLELDTGVLKPWKSSYDQGTMMVSACLLYEITGEQRYLNEAMTTAQSSISLMFITAPKSVMKGNPIFKSWCVGWMVRGIMKVYSLNETRRFDFMKHLKNVLNDTLATKDKNGQYDPYFCSGDWWDGDEFDTDALQPTGVATILLLTACHNVYQLNN